MGIVLILLLVQAISSQFKLEMILHQTLKELIILVLQTQLQIILLDLVQLIVMVVLLFNPQE